MVLFNKATLSTLILALGSAQSRPNIIIMQPDDLPFLDEWAAPPNNPSDPDHKNNSPFNAGNGMKNINSLHMNGLQMMQAYTASPMCGTSRYSTITGKMPSRAASSRKKATKNSDDPHSVTIPTTKLEDNDCTDENLAMAFKNANYKTAIFGKWHLSEIDDSTYTYDDAQNIVKGCGFDTVEGLYIENLSNEGGFNEYTDGTRFSHNMEWMTYEAIRFINATTANNEDFFMYFNPTVPHASNDVVAAIEDFDCKLTADENHQWEGDSDPWIKGMSEDEGCWAYRESITLRANNIKDDYGKIWVDDTVGALLEALATAGVLNDTIFLFQEDHGMDSKSALYEGGIRIPQFIHYPNGIKAGTTFDGLVSTVDIAATMMDFAGITPMYELDGKSWKDAITDSSLEDYWENERCIFFEMGQDRAVRCGCYKYLDIFNEMSSTYVSSIVTNRNEGGQSNLLDGNLFDMCGGTEHYITSPANSQEENTVENNSEEIYIKEVLDCHLEATDADRINPDYSMCSPWELTNVPESTQTCRDSTASAVINENDRRCKWIVNNDKCENAGPKSHCQLSCKSCNRCRDSKLFFKYEGNPITCAYVTSTDMCTDDDILASTCPESCGLCQNH